MNPEDAEREIEALYRELEEILTLQQELEEKRKSKLARLRELQEMEAQRYRALVESRMKFKPGESKAILDEVDRFLAEHENLAPPAPSL